MPAQHELGGGGRRLRHVELCSGARLGIAVAGGVPHSSYSAWRLAKRASRSHVLWSPVVEQPGHPDGQTPVTGR